MLCIYFQLDIFLIDVQLYLYLFSELLQITVRINPIAMQDKRGKWESVGQVFSSPRTGRIQGHER